VLCIRCRREMLIADVIGIKC